MFTSRAAAGVFSFDPEGDRPIPKAQMNQEAGQYLLWDRDSRRCVRLGQCRESANALKARDAYQPQIPSHLVGAAAYSLGHGSKWVGNEKIVVQAPDKALARRWAAVRSQAEHYARALLSIHKDRLAGAHSYMHSPASLGGYVLAMLDTPNESVTALMDIALENKPGSYQAASSALEILNNLAAGHFKFPTRGVVRVDAIYFRPA